MQQDLEGFRLSPQQRHLWQLQRLDGSSAYWAYGEMAIAGQLQVERFKVAVQRVVEQHEILHTRFQSLPGLVLPVQVIADCQVDWREDCDLCCLSPDEQSAQLDGLRSQFTQPALDVVQVPVLRLQLIRLAGDRYRLLMQLPALCADSRTLENLVQHISQTYAALAQNLPFPESAPLQYADLAEWQHDLLESADTETGRTYWQQQPFISHLTAPLPFEQCVETRAFQPQPYGFEVHLGEAQLPADAAAWLLAAWQVLLWRLTGQTEGVLGLTCEGRSHDALQPALGLLAKAVPLLWQLEANQPFQQIVQQVETAMNQSCTWQDYFDWSLFDGADSPKSPYFPVGFEWIEPPNANVAAGVSFALERHQVYFDRFKLKLVCSLQQGRLLAALHYDANQFQQVDIERLAASFKMLLQGSIAHPQRAIAQFPVVSPDEQHWLIREINQTQVDYSTKGCIQDWFEAQVEQTPDAIAIVFETEQLTYRELNQRANWLAHALQQRGVRADVPVALYLGRSLDWVVGLLGVLKAGGAYVPFDPALPAAGLALRLQNLQPAVVLTQSAWVERVPQPQFQVITLDAVALDSFSDRNPHRSVSSADLAYILFTSGSTGTPKGVAVEHRQLLNYVQGIIATLDLPSGAAFAFVSSVAADLGNTAIFPCLCTGGCLHVIAPERATDPQAFAEYSDRHPIDCLKIVPSHLQALLMGDRPAALLPRQRLILGGEAASWELIEQIQQHSPQCQIFNHYGPTEATVGTLTYRVADKPDGELSLPLGRPLPNTQIYLLDSQLQPVPIGIPGELYIGGAGVARGYWQQPDLTAARFVCDPFNSAPQARLYKTGDLAYYQPDGNLVFLGRVDDQVKIRGYRVELGEIAAVLAEHSAIREGMAIARPDARGNAQLVAFAVTQPGQAVTPETIQAFLQTRLPEYMVPAQVIPLTAFPLTPNGKVDRQGLLDLAERQPNSTHLTVEPRTPIEAKLAQVWATVLNLPQVGIQDNFFALGGDSILSIQVVAKAQQSGLKFTPKQLFQHQTIAELARVVEAIAPVQTDSECVTGTLPLTPIQHRFFEQVQTHPHHWNQAVLLELNQPLDLTLLKQAVYHLLAHHDALRLRFEQTETGWQQTYGDLADGREDGSDPPLPPFKRGELSGSPPFQGGFRGISTMLPENTVPVERVDLTQTSPAEHQSVIETESTTWQTRLHLIQGPLMRVVWFDSGEISSSRLLLIVHHLVVDGVSWRILLDDLQTAYQQLQQGQPVTLPSKTASFQQWANQLQADAQSAAIQQDFPFWQRRQPDISPLPRDFTGKQNLVSTSQTVVLSLSASDTETLLHQVPATYPIQVQEVLLTALVQTIAAWIGKSSLLIDLEGHGRHSHSDSLDLSRTVGWFTAIFPAYLDLGDATSPGTALTRVKDQFRQIPNHGLSYGLLRYLAADADLRQQMRSLPSAEIVFNYLGQFDSVLGETSLGQLASESSSQTRAPENLRPYLLELNSWVSKGQLHLEWTYSTACHRRSTIAPLSQQMLTALRSLLEYCLSGADPGYTASDFPQARLNQTDLNKLLSTLQRAGGNR
jgi:amino acid adenylation domain-containing protein/non-ribosomal peptide synthase protein (TIGR01720 family)